MKKFIKSKWWEPVWVALVFYTLHAWVQFSTPFFADTNDSFYHAKMGALMGEKGILQEFPWLFFTSLHDQFVNHHLLFHIILWPFTVMGNWAHTLGLTTLPGMIFGPKVLITMSITALFVMAYVMLRKEGIRFAWGWLLLLLCVPYDFFFRMHMIRAQSLSLFVLLLGLYAIWQKKYLLLGILSFAYVWLYGGFFFLPIFVITYLVAQYVQEKELDLRPLWWSLGGVILGFLLNPYFPKNIDFLYRQIFETGLGYQINVGGEWKPYDTWYLFQMGVVTFALQIGAITWALLKGLKQNARSITLLVLSFFFLILMWKSKRFVEYWPFFAVLSSAFLLKEYLAEMYINRVRVLNTFLVVFTLYAVVALYTGKLAVPTVHRLSVWMSPALTGFLVAGLVFASLVGLIYSYMTVSQQKPPLRKLAHEVLMGTLIALLPIYALGGMDAVKRDIAPQTAYIQGAQDIMRCITDKGNAKPGDIVFTDDWDIFPLFFFYNHLTYYIVGLDPVFMDAWNRPLYKEFAAITMGTDRDDLYRKITGDFQAKFVVADKDHAALRSNVEATAGFTKLCDNGTFTAYIATGN
ncbi:hypothetical protein COW46_03730 [Candidatus Gracilibacteria bacterium CG17_big_fil_post_rev_8_21_14_2_50_48_13]|nr:MAG: hypothetical protein COW46_03730 [Candidatus Gracilibacteria bacterium CG17_big_fil_post_rev_8_21_14_2_50_48_13]